MKMHEVLRQVKLTNPWTGSIEVIYWPDNMYRSKVYRGVMGTVSDIKKRGKWDWVIEIFLGTVWEYSKGDFKVFVEELFKVWLEEYLHMVYRFEKEPTTHLWDEEKVVKTWVQMLTMET